MLLEGREEEEEVRAQTDYCHGMRHLFHGGPEGSKAGRAWKNPREMVQCSMDRLHNLQYLRMPRASSSSSAGLKIIWLVTM